MFKFSELKTLAYKAKTKSSLKCLDIRYKLCPSSNPNSAAMWQMVVREIYLELGKTPHTFVTFWNLFKHILKKMNLKSNPKRWNENIFITVIVSNLVMQSFFLSHGHFQNCISSYLFVLKSHIKQITL